MKSPLGKECHVCGTDIWKDKAIYPITVTKKIDNIWHPIKAYICRNCWLKQYQKDGE